MKKRLKKEDLEKLGFKNEDLNPTNLKVGDSLYLIKSRNSQIQFEGKVLKIVAPYTGNYYIVQNPNFVANGMGGAQQIYIYTSGPADLFVEAKKDLIIQALKNQQKDLVKQSEILQDRIDFYEKYEDEEEYLASKLQELMKAGDVKGMAKILRTMKTATNFL